METLIILSCAAHRLWLTWLTQDIARPFRDRLIRRGGRLSYFARCQFCTSIWAGLLIYVLWQSGTIGQVIVWTFALSFGLSLMNLMTQIMERYAGAPR